jgi:AcrR family transcriptional regulator
LTNHVQEHQRRRIRKATIEVTAEGGFASLTVAAIIARAVVSRVTFYKLYPSKHDAFHDAVNRVVTQIRETVSGGPDPLAELTRISRLRAAATRCLLIELPGIAPHSYEDYLEGVVDDVAQATGLERTIAHLLVGGVAGIFRNTGPVDIAELEAFVRPYLDDVAVAA